MVVLFGIKIKSIETEEERKSFIVSFFTYFGCTMMILFGIKGIVEKRVVYSLIMFGIVALNIVNIIVFRKKRNLEFAPLVTLYTMGFLFLLLFLFIGKEGTGILWFYTFPPLAILLTDNKKGIVYSIILAAITLVFVFHNFGLNINTYGKEVLIRFYAVYIVVMGLIVIFEYARSSSFTAYMNILTEVKSKNEDLQSAQEELKVSNEELQQLNENIEKQKRTIEENELRLKTIIENQGEGFAIIDNLGYFTFTNRTAEEILEFPPNGMLGLNIYDYISIRDYMMVQNDIKSRLIGEKMSYDVEMATHLENRKYVLMTLSPNVDNEQNIAGQIVLFRDITQKKREERKLKKLNSSLKKYFTVIEQSQMSILITDPRGNIEYANPFFSKITGYSKNELIGENTRILKTGKTPRSTFDSLWETINSGDTWTGELINAKKDGTFYVERATISPVKDENGIVTDFVAIKEDITELKKTQEELDKQRSELDATYKDLRDSISYAKTIQDALLIKKTLINQWLSESFIFSKPRDLVGGDFHYVNKIENKIIVAVADCTGHGIPGAFMTLLGLTYLHEHLKLNESQTASQVLERLRQNIKDIFKTFGSENNNGMDMTLCMIDPETQTLQFAGANNPLYIMRDSELQIFEGTKNPIGYYPSEREFENHTIELKKNDFIYLTTDGLQDQFGGDKNRTFTRKRLRELFIDIHTMPVSEQEEQIKQTLEFWQGNNKQVDDITILGFKWE